MDSENITVRIVSDKGQGFRLESTGFDVNGFLSTTDLRNLLEDSINCLENDIGRVGSKVSDFSLGGFCWSFTWEMHRLDGFGNTVYEYFVWRLIEKICSRKKVEKIEIDCELSKGFLVFLKIACRENGIILKNRQSVFSRVKGLLPWSTKFRSANVKPILSIAKSWISYCLKRFRSQPIGKTDNLILVESKLDFNHNRYGELLETAGYDQLVFFRKHLFSHQIKNLPKTFGVLNFSKFISFAGLFRATILAIKVTSKVRWLSFKGKPNLFLTKLKCQSIVQTLNLMLKQIVFRRGLTELSPRLLVLNTSVSSARSRLLATVASECNVPVLIAASRAMLSSCNAEDRICPVDISNKHQSYVGDFIVVRDRYSYTHLVEQGIDENKVAFFPTPTTDSSTSQPADSIAKDENSFSRAIVLLFTERSVNSRILSLLSKSNLEQFEEIVIRRHPSDLPSDRLNEQQRDITKGLGIKVTEITGIPLEEFEFTDCIAIAVNTSAAVDLARVGCGVIWLPFLSIRSMTYLDIMNILGIVCESESDFQDVMKGFVGTGDVNGFIRKTHRQYHEFFQTNKMLEFSDKRQVERSPLI